MILPLTLNLHFSSSGLSRLFLMRILRLSWFGDGRGTAGSNWKEQTTDNPDIQRTDDAAKKYFSVIHNV